MMLSLRIGVLTLVIVVAVGLAATVEAQDESTADAANDAVATRNLTIRAAVKISEPLAYINNNSHLHNNFNGPTFVGLQMDLVEQLKVFALQDDGIRLDFELVPTPEGLGSYDAALHLIANDCSSATNLDETECNRYDMILGDYWPSSARYQRVEFSPAWLRSSVSAVKYLHSFKHSHVTTFAQAIQGRHRICAEKDSAVPRVMRRLFPQADILECGPNNTVCFPYLKNESCALLAADDLQVRYLALHDRSLEVTKEQLNTQSIVWPMRRGKWLNTDLVAEDTTDTEMDIEMEMDPAYLVKKWLFKASEIAFLDDLKFNYFHASLCPLGTSGVNCDEPCHAEHGAGDRLGRCICDSTRWTGPDCATEVQTNLNLIPQPLLIVGYTMFGINAAVCLACFLWLYKYRSSCQVQTAQPFFLCLVLLGCIVSSSTILALSQQHNGNGPVPACMVIPWTYSIGFCITFGTLYAKLRRVQALFRGAAAFRRTVVTAKETLLIIGTILAMDVVLLTVWTIVDPLQWQRQVITSDKNGYVLESEGYCTSRHWQAFAGAICGLHFLLLLFASYLSYTSRHISTDFSESKYLAIAMISNLQIFLVGVPVLFLVGTDPDSAYFVRSAIIWMNDFVVVALIFGNLMYSVHKMGARNGRSSTGSGGVMENQNRIQSAILKYREAEAKSRRGSSGTSFAKRGNNTTVAKRVSFEPVKKDSLVKEVQEMVVDDPEAPPAARPVAEVPSETKNRKESDKGDKTTTQHDDRDDSSTPTALPPA